jgi:hypothetical protein
MKGGGRGLFTVLPGISLEGKRESTKTLDQLAGLRSHISTRHVGANDTTARFD